MASHTFRLASIPPALERRKKGRSMSWSAILILYCYINTPKVFPNGDRRLYHLELPTILMFTIDLIMAVIKKLETALVPYFTPRMIATIAAVTFVAFLLRIRLRPGLRNIPGPFLASFTPFDRLWTAISGRAFLFHLDYHRKYGPLVRLGPNHVSVADSQYIPLIYGIASKFYKVRESLI